MLTAVLAAILGAGFGTGILAAVTFRHALNQPGPGEPEIISSITCTQCRPDGRPPCTCSGNCGSDRCAEAHHTTLSLFTPADQEWLHSLGVKPRPQVVWYRRWAGRKTARR